MCSSATEIALHSQRRPISYWAGCRILEIEVEHRVAGVVALDHDPHRGIALPAHGGLEVELPLGRQLRRRLADRGAVDGSVAGREADADHLLDGGPGAGVEPAGQSGADLLEVLAQEAGLDAACLQHPPRPAHVLREGLRLPRGQRAAEEVDMVAGVLQPTLPPRRSVALCPLRMAVEELRRDGLRHRLAQVDEPGGQGGALSV